MCLLGEGRIASVLVESKMCIEDFHGIINEYS